MKKIIVTVFAIALSFILMACVQPEEHDVYVTVYPMEYVVDQLFIDTELTAGMVPGVSSHNEAIDWSPKDIIAMGNADLLIYVGANFDYYIESKGEEVFTNKNVALIKTEGNLVDFIPGITHEHTDGEAHVDTDEHTLGFDPHFWVSPKRMITVAENVYDLLIDTYPDYESIITDNYDQLMTKLQGLDSLFTTTISNQTRMIMTSTNLYSYLHEDYDLEYLPISPGYHQEADQFTTAQKQEVVNEAVIHEITHIIYERNSTSPLSTAVLSTLQDLGYSVEKLEFIIMDALTIDDVKLNRDYLIIINQNINVIKEASQDEGANNG
jgi:zinc transport system substrate-binding protein